MHLNKMVLSPNFNDLLLGGLAIAAIVVSIIASPSPEVVKFFGFSLPQTCAFKGVTGYGCFGCGLTRSFAYMGELSILSAFKLHPAGPFLYLLVLTQIPYRFYRFALRNTATRA